MSRFTVTVIATGNAYDESSARSRASALVTELNREYGSDATFTLGDVTPAAPEPVQVHSIDMTAAERSRVDALLTSLRG